MVAHYAVAIVRGRFVALKSRLIGPSRASKGRYDPRPEDGLHSGVHDCCVGHLTVVLLHLPGNPHENRLFSNRTTDEIEDFNGIPIEWGYVTKQLVRTPPPGFRRCKREVGVLENGHV